MEDGLNMIRFRRLWWKTWWLFLLASLAPAAEIPPAREQFPETIRFEGFPRTAEDWPTAVFTDQGAWHAYALPGPGDETGRGGFAGPFLLTHRNGVWAGSCLSQFRITDLATGQELDPAAAKWTGRCPPGRLEQTLEWPDAGLRLEMELVFVSGRGSLIRVVVTNLLPRTRRLQPAWQAAWFDGQVELTPGPDGWAVTVPGTPVRGAIVVPGLPGQARPAGLMTGTASRLELPPLELKPRSRFETAIGHIFAFSEKETFGEKKNMVRWLAKPAQAVRQNRQAWHRLLTRLQDRLRPEYRQPGYFRLAVKCVQTLLLNWRSPAGELQHAGLFPSLHYKGFHGFWAWDSWKHAAALAILQPELAKDQVRAMFDFQNGDGMIADCVFRDPALEAHNWRDTKPPLAAWAVWQIARAATDRSFVAELYPKLVNYHRWWYRDRDHDRNSLCEYGCTDGTLVAAKWESGMDNAVRFDQALLERNGEQAWSMNQESVDLNSYLYAEKRCLARLAMILGKKTEAADWNREADELGRKIREYFFDAGTGFFYDRRLPDGAWITAAGPEGWIPPWAGAASRDQAAAAAVILADPAKFATTVPFPTLAANHPSFNPEKGYWRGPVWLDQAGFALAGLERYGFRKQAWHQFENLLSHAEGLLDPGGAIRENYHPLTGAGLNARHFSWSAAHLLLQLTGEGGTPQP